MTLNKWWRRRPALKILAANCASVSMGPRRSLRALRKAVKKAKRRNVDIVCVSEAADWLVRDHVDLDVWDVYQFGELGSPESGLALVVRKDRARALNAHQVIGSRETSEGGGIRMRPILLADIQVLRSGEWVNAGNVAVVHSPPNRAPRARAEYEAALAKVDADYKVGDFNRTRAQLKAYMRYQRIRSNGVISVTVSKRHKAGRARGIRHRSDHLAVLVTVRLNQEARR